jgi:hypothetical protein
MVTGLLVVGFIAFKAAGVGLLLHSWLSLYHFTPHKTLYSVLEPERHHGKYCIEDKVKGKVVRV